MEAFAAALAHADHEIGRVIDALRAAGELDNTLVIFLQGDNGASAEGGPEGALFQQSRMNGQVEDPAYALSRIDDLGGPKLYNHYSAAWGWATDAPFRYYKQIASYFGGTRNGLVISWPERIKTAGLRTQFHYVTDIAPTIYDAAGIRPPTTLNGTRQMPIDGISMKYSFDHPNQPSRRRVQYFEVVGNAGIYQDGWMASMRPTYDPWDYLNARKVDPRKRQWELFNLAEDFTQAKDLSAEQPAKLRAMQKLFWAEARKNNVLPMQPEAGAGAPSPARGRSSFWLPVGLTDMPYGVAPPLANRSFTIEADVTVPRGGAQGVIASQGGRFGGWALYVKDGQPVFHYNALDPHRYSIASPAQLEPGARHLVAHFAYDGGRRGSGGTLTLQVDGRTVAEGRIDRTLPNWISHTEGLSVGRDTQTPVSEDYAVEGSAFNGAFAGIRIKLD